MRALEPTPDVFQAIADPNRRKILDLLSEGEKPVQALVERFDISFAAVSQHLKLLRDAGLVTRRAQGRRRLYRLNPVPLKKVHDWTAVYENAWRRHLRKLHLVLDKETPG